MVLYLKQLNLFPSFKKKQNLFLSSSWPSLIIRKAFLMSEIIVNLLDLKYKRSFVISVIKLTPGYAASFRDGDLWVLSEQLKTGLIFVGLLTCFSVLIMGRCGIHV